MIQTKDEVIGEVREIFADAVAGVDLERIDQRLAVAATKLDAIVEDHRDNIISNVISAIDAFRKTIGNNPAKAQAYSKALLELLNDNIDGAESALDDFSVHDFIDSLS